MGVVEIAERTWHIESLIGLRNRFQYLLVGDGGDALLIDAGTSATPHEAILPALRRVRVPAESASLVVARSGADVGAFCARAATSWTRSMRCSTNASRVRQPCKSFASMSTCDLVRSRRVP